MQYPLIKTFVFLLIAFTVAGSGQPLTSDAELTDHFQDAFSAGYCVPEVLEQAQVELSDCRDAWRDPVANCAEETGLYDFVTSSDLSEEEWAARYEAKAYELTVCLFAVLGDGVDDPDNPNRALYRAIIDYDDTLRELEEP